MNFFFWKKLNHVLTIHESIYPPMFDYWNLHEFVIEFQLRTKYFHLKYEWNFPFPVRKPSHKQPTTNCQKPTDNSRKKLHKLQPPFSGFHDSAAAAAAVVTPVPCHSYACKVRVPVDRDDVRNLFLYNIKMFVPFELQLSLSFLISLANEISIYFG